MPILSRHPSRAVALAALALAVLASSSFASIASAQQPSPDPTVRARELYQEGRRLGELGRWEEARAAFEQALALREAPLLHFALGTAQAETGRLVAARASLRRFVATAADETSRAQVPAAQSAIAALEPRIAHLTIRISGGMAHEVRLDGLVLESGSLGHPVNVNPGARRIEVIASPGSTAIVRETRLADGGREEVVIEIGSILPRSGRGTTGTRPGRHDDDTTRSGGVLSQWWFWTAVGVVVVGTTVGVVVATQSGARDPFAGDAPGGAIQTLRLP